MRDPVDEARRWVQYAHWDMVDVQNNMQSDQIPHPIVCFHCQQAAEKMLKAVLVFHGQPPPRTHDLTAILRRLEPLVGSVEDVLPHAAILNPFAVEVRYPANAIEVGVSETEEARASSEAIFAWMREQFPMLFE